MFRTLRAKLAERKQRKLARYADEYGHMDREKLAQLRQQQSPLRGMNRRRG